MRRSVVVVLAWGILMAPSVWVATAPAEAAPGDHRLDCEDWRYGPADEPAVAAGRVRPRRLQAHVAARPAPELRRLAAEPLRPEGRGRRPRVGAVARHRTTCVIAVLDSGIKWRDAGDMADLATKALHQPRRGAAAVLARRADGDCNGDGVLRHRRLRRAHRPQRQRARRSRGPDPRPRRTTTASTTTATATSTTSPGWDFLYGDNNPLDTVELRPRHRRGQGLDRRARTAPATSAAARSAGSSRSGWATRSSPTAAGSPRACCSRSTPGADVVQEALGAISNPRQAQQAIDAAYRPRRGRGRVDGRRGVRSTRTCRRRSSTRWR